MPRRIDIVAHEMTHGIIAHEKNLLYLNEPGAVNKSLADIFGTLIELDAKGDGRQLAHRRSFAGLLDHGAAAQPRGPEPQGRQRPQSMFNRTARSSRSPTAASRTTTSEVLTADDQQCGSTAYKDNGCVHFNSGILNKFAYLISEGGTHRGVDRHAASAAISSRASRTAP